MGKELETLTTRQKEELKRYKAAAADWCRPGGVWGGDSIRVTMVPRLIVEDDLPPLGRANQLKAALAAGEGRKLVNYLYIMRENCKEIAAKSEAFLRKWGQSVPPPNRPYKGL